MDVLRGVLFSLLFFFLFITFGGEKKTPEKVLKELFPNAEVEVKNLILTKEEVKKIKELTGKEPDSRLISVYIVKQNGKVLAYGFVDIHRVRTKPEALLFVLSPEGKIQLIEVLAFYEPPEYAPPPKWLELFKGKSPENPPKYKRNIPNITGATLTARAVSKSAYKVLALWKVLFGEGR